MKTKSAVVMIVMLLFSTTLIFANGMKTEKIKVYGKCESCKARIEKAASGVSGVSKATWNQKDLMLTVTYDDSKANVGKIEEAVAKAGHDTDNVRATDKAYNDLPGCCHYDRPAQK